MALHIATKKITRVLPTLCSADLLNAIQAGAITGHNDKCATINGMKLKHVSHVSLGSLSENVKVLLGKLFQFVSCFQFPFLMVRFSKKFV